MKLAFKIALALVLWAGLAAGTGCQQTKGRVDVRTILPHVPKQYRDCFKKVVVLPSGPLDRSQVVKLVADLRKSELAKTECGRSLIRWYDSVKGAYGAP